MFGKFVNKYTKNPVEIVKSLKDALHIVVVASTQRERQLLGRSHSISANALAKAKGDVYRKLETVRGLVVGGPPKKDSRGKFVPDMSHEYLVSQLTHELFNTNVLLMLIKHLPLLEFECKKLVTVVFNNMLLRECNERVPAIDLLCKRPDVIVALLKGYESQDSRVALNSGCMLRKCARYEELARLLMVKHSRDFFKFFEYVELPIFDIASDAFLTFKKFLTRHPTATADFMRRNYDDFFNGGYRQLISSENYVTQRQSIKLLSELLLDRQNYALMQRYIGSADNLQLIMAVMTGKSRRLQYDAFHVFKVFVANPQKTPPIQELLVANKERLVQLLADFQIDRTEDDQFREERDYVLRQIKEMRPLEPKPPKKKQSVTLVVPGAAASSQCDKACGGGARPKVKKNGHTEEIAALLKKHGINEDEPLCLEDLACALPMLRKY